MPTIYLIRHGETEWNRTGQVQGQSDVPLNDLGRRQASALRPRLEKLGIAHLYASDLSRTRETAALALPHLVPRLDPRLREIDVGLLAGRTQGNFTGIDPAWRAAWQRDRIRTPFPGGESTLDLQRRALAALAEIVDRHRGETVAVVSHGGPIKAIICAALSLPLPERSHFRLDNTGLTGVYWEGEERTVLFLNDIAHLAGLAAPQRMDL